MRLGTRVYRFDRPKPTVLIATLCVLTLLLGLGIWQIERLEWKEALLTQVQNASKGAPIEGLPQNLTPDAVIYHRFVLRGQWLHDKELHIGARYHLNKLGYHIATPLRLNDGRVVLINRGWVPSDHKLSSSRPDSLAQNMVEVIGIARDVGSHGWFIPDNQPEKNVWFWMDLTAMQQATGLTLLPIVIEQLGKQDKNTMPVPFTGEINLRNDHLGYAITWFALAIACSIMFTAAHLRRVM